MKRHGQVLTKIVTVAQLKPNNPPTDSIRDVLEVSVLKPLTTRHPQAGLLGSAAIAIGQVSAAQCGDPISPILIFQGIGCQQGLISALKIAFHAWYWILGTVVD